MKQALKALEECTAYTSNESWSPSMTRECEAAITALRAAIKEAQGLAEKVPARGTLLEQTLGKVWDEMPHPDYQKEMKRLDHIRIRIMQEAYDLADRDDSEGYNSVKVMCSEVLGMIDRLLDERQWQGLTEEDCEEILRWVEWKEIGSDQSVAPQKLIAYVEKKLREKNNG